MNEVDEYLAVFPEDADKFNDAIIEFGKMIAWSAFKYEVNRNIESQKDFALAVKDLPLSGVMFKARKNGTEFEHEFNQLPVSKRAEWLKERLTKQITR